MIFNLFKKKEILPPNILLTNLCNQNCYYCFARQEMEKSKVKEMSLLDFKRLVKILKRNNIKTLRLMGGEPTLHSRFGEIIEISIKNFKEIIIFTNGLIPAKNKKIIFKNIKKFSFNFNLDTSAFEKNKLKRKKILKTIDEFSKKTNVNVGFTISDLKKKYENLIEDFDKKELSMIGMRFGFAKAIVGEKPFFEKKDNKILGKRITKLVKFFRSKGVKNIYLDCGLKKEMFAKNDLKYFLDNVFLKGWGCEGKWSSFDIAPNLLVFPCFPFYKEVKKITFFKNFKEIEKYFSKRNCCTYDS